MSEESLPPLSDQPLKAKGKLPAAVRRAFRLLSQGRRVSALAAVLVILLALGAVLWPGNQSPAFQGICLVYDPAGGRAREASLFGPLTDFLVNASGHPLDLVLARDVGEFQAQLDLGADFVICPDGLGLALDAERFVPIATGRRTAPRNLRPRCVLVYRQSAGLQKTPWRARPDRTIFGDSLSLSATGILRVDPGASLGLPAGCTFGPDPYDHSPALHALRLGCFDYGLVRQWDAERFFAEDLLPNEVWGMEIMTGPVPDMVLFISRDIPAGTVLDLSGDLARLGRARDGESPQSAALIRGLIDIHLSGFNLMVDPSLDLVRGSFPGRWPAAGQ